MECKKSLFCLFFPAVANMVEDGESSGPAAFKCPVTSDQKLTLNLKEDDAIEEADVHVGLPEENPQVSVSPPDTQEIHVKILFF